MNDVQALQHGRPTWLVSNPDKSVRITVGPVMLHQSAGETDQNGDPQLAMTVPEYRLGLEGKNTGLPDDVWREVDGNVRYWTKQEWAEVSLATGLTVRGDGYRIRRIKAGDAARVEGAHERTEDPEMLARLTWLRIWLHIASEDRGCPWIIKVSTDANVHSCGHREDEQLQGRCLVEPCAHQDQASNVGLG